MESVMAFMSSSHDPIADKANHYQVTTYLANWSGSSPLRHSPLSYPKTASRHRYNSNSLRPQSPNRARLANNAL